MNTSVSPCFQGRKEKFFFKKEKIDVGVGCHDKRLAKKKIFLFFSMTHKTSVLENKSLPTVANRALRPPKQWDVVAWRRSTGGDKVRGCHMYPLHFLLGAPRLEPSLTLKSTIQHFCRFFEEFFLTRQFYASLN